VWLDKRLGEEKRWERLLEDAVCGGRGGFAETLLESDFCQKQAIHV